MGELPPSFSYENATSLCVTGFPEASVNGALGVRAYGGSVRFTSFYSHIVCKRIQFHNEIISNSVGTGVPDCPQR